MNIRFILAALISLMAGRTFPTVHDFQTVQSNTASLVYHWTFEGEDGTEAMQDKKGSAVLQERNIDSTEPLVWLSGYDETTQALRSQRNEGTVASGVGLRTVSTIDMPSSGALEMLYRPVNTSEVQTYGLGGFQQERWYFLCESNAGIQFRLGSSGFQSFIGGTTGVPLIEGNWYYIVYNYEISGGEMRLDIYVRNLTAEGTLLKTYSGSFGFNSAATAGLRFGIGTLGSTSYFVSSEFDAIAIYNSELSLEEITARTSLIPRKRRLSLVLITNGFNE